MSDERYQRRLDTFVREGLERPEAERLARMMMERDRPDSGDDRRVCFECRNLKPNARCRAGFLPYRFVLQRCDRFELRGQDAIASTPTSSTVVSASAGMGQSQLTPAINPMPMVHHAQSRPRLAKHQAHIAA